MEKSSLFGRKLVECSLIGSAPRLTSRRSRRHDVAFFFQLEIFDFTRRLLGQIVFLFN